MKKLFTPAIVSFLLTSQVWANTNAQLKPIDDAIAQFEAGKLDEAKQLLTSLVKENKKDVKALTYLSRVFAREGDLDEAEEMIEKAVKLAPKNAEVQNLSGQIFGSLAQSASMFSALGYAKDSLKGFTKAVELEPDNLDYRLGLLNYHLYAPGIAGGDEDIAMEQAQAIAKLDKKQGYIAMAEAYFAKDDEENLLQHLKSTPTELENDLDVLFSKAMLWQRGKKLLNSELELQKLINLAGDDKRNPTRLSALYQLGKLSVLREKNLELGVSALTEYIAVENKESHLPDNNWAEFRLANLLALQGNTEQATQIYKKIKKLTEDVRLKKEIQKVL